jgi:hypothetical protein
MTHRDSIEAVMRALQRQQSEAYEREPIPAEPIIEVARAFLPRSPTQNARIDGPGRLAPADDSLIKARYASTILRVAETSDRETAARLVGSIGATYRFRASFEKSRTSTYTLSLHLFSWRSAFATRLTPSSSLLGKLR